MLATLGLVPLKLVINLTQSTYKTLATLGTMLLRVPLVVFQQVVWNLMWKKQIMWGQMRLKAQVV